MGWLSLLVIVGIVLFILVLKLKQKSGQSKDFPYTNNEVLFTPAERSFFGVLEQAIGDKYRVFGKVRVADVVSVKSLSDRSAWQRAFNRISAKHFDFVLCRNDDITVFAAIELDDKSHQKNQRQIRDVFMAELCNAIGLPLIQVPAQSAYSVSDIRTKVLSAGNLAGAELEISLTHHKNLKTEPKSEYSHERSESQKTAPCFSESDGPLCPKCSLPMIRRCAKSGANAGQEFWGCSAFPKCRGIIPISAQPDTPADAKSRAAE